MAFTAKLKGRYQPKEIIGEGGMGVVYRALDLEVQSEVAVKTMHPTDNPELIELFRRECAVLRKLRHPNIVDLYDYGVSDEGGHKTPFFVMPLLPGVTLDKLIRNHAARLTVERVVDIIMQTCRGLQAAHELGLVHRDVKPSNILVLEDDSVKLIDFGVVHVSDQHSRTGLKGTLRYMSPEQLEMNPPTAASDIFSLGVVCYEALTRRKPFGGTTDEEIRQNILELIPPPVSDLNPAASIALSQVIHAAMAKRPWHRTSTARQFGEELQKALYNQPIERFDASHIEPRIRRAQKALEESEYDFACEILGELQAEGHLHSEVAHLNQQIRQAQQTKAIARALESARKRFAEEEYPLALQKVEDVLRLEAENPEALALKTEIESRYKANQIDNWFRLAQDHVKNYAYNPARQALQNVLRLKPTDTTAIRMLSEVDRRESDYLREKREKEELYQAAMDLWNRGEVSTALSKLERVLELNRRAPDIVSADAGLTYQNLYNQVRSEHQAIKHSFEEARNALARSDFDSASAICEQFLSKYPSHALFQALKFDIGELQRQHVSAFIARVDREVEAEPDVNRKVAILSEALQRYPAEHHFKERLEQVTKKRDLVTSITQKVRNLEERGQYADALGQLEILRAINPLYPGLDLEFVRLTKRRDQQSHTEAKRRWVDQIDRALGAGDFTHALNLVTSALTDFPGDSELLSQERLARDGQTRSNEAVRLLEEAQGLCGQGELEAGLDRLWQAIRLSENNALIGAVLVETLLKRASAEMDRDWTVSEQLIRQALDVDPGNTQARSLQRMCSERQRDRAVDEILSNSRHLQAAGEIQAAAAEVEKGLVAYPDNARLMARRDVLLKSLGDVRRSDEKEKDLGELRVLKQRLAGAGDVAASNSLVEQSRVIARKHPGDHDVQAVLKEVEDLKSATRMFQSGPAAATAQRKEKAEEASSPALEPQTQDVPPPPAAAVVPAPIPVPVAGPSPAQAERRPGSNKTLLFAGIAVVVVASLVAAFLLRGRNPVTSVTPSTLDRQVAFQSSVPGARLLVNGEDRGTVPQSLTLPPGDYRIDATLPGYKSTPVSLKVAEGENTPATVDILLEPLPSMVRLFSDFQQVMLDDKVVPLQGAFETDLLAPGPHSVRLSSPVAGTIVVDFELIPGQVPVVRRVMGGQVTAVVVSSLADSGRIYANRLPLKVGLNGQAPQDLSNEGLQLAGLAAGLNELLLDDGRGSRKETVQVDASPLLTLLIGSNMNAGNLRITTSVEGATVVVEPADRVGPTRTAETKNGFALLARLDPKPYRIRIAADGYAPQERTETVIKGQEVSVPFTLASLVVTSSLEIKGGTPDADVSLGVLSLGRLGSNGDFSAADLPTGRQTIFIRKSEHESKSIEREFAVGKAVSLAGEDARLVQFGWIEVNANPSNAEISYQLAGDAVSRGARNGDRVALKAGRYAITVRAEGFQPSTSPVEVNSGKTTAFNPRLAALATPAVPTRVTTITGSVNFDNVKNLPDGSFQATEAGASFSERAAGTYSFKIKLDRGINVFGGKNARWNLGYINEKNYVQYEIDEKDIKCAVFLENKKTDCKAIRSSASKSGGDYFEVNLQVSERAVRINGADMPLPLDRTALPGQSLLIGKFGLPKGTTVKDFSFIEAPKK